MIPTSTCEKKFRYKNFLEKSIAELKSYQDLNTQEEDLLNHLVKELANTNNYIDKYCTSEPNINQSKERFAPKNKKDDIDIS